MIITESCSSNPETGDDVRIIHDANSAPQYSINGAPWQLVPRRMLGIDARIAKHTAGRLLERHAAECQSGEQEEETLP